MLGPRNTPQRGLRALALTRMGVARGRDGGNVQAFRMLVRTTLAMVGVPALVMLTMQHVVLDRLFTFASAGDKMVWAGTSTARYAPCPEAHAHARAIASLLYRRGRPLLGPTGRDRLPGGGLPRRWRRTGRGEKE